MSDNYRATVPLEYVEGGWFHEMRLRDAKLPFLYPPDFILPEDPEEFERIMSEEETLP